jgi:hypothetical protein
VNDDTESIGERIRAASQSVSAPLTLRAHVSHEPARRTPRQPSRLALAGIGAMLAVIATVSALVAPGPPAVQTVAAAVLHAPEGPAPAGGSYLPGYRAIGVRTDTIAGREAKTIIYRRGSAGIHYTIVDGKPLDLPGTRRTTAGDRKLALVRDGDLGLVVWHANGKTCILASRAVAPDAMAALLRRA